MLNRPRLPALLALTLAFSFITGAFAAAPAPLTIMPLGDSITKGAVDSEPSKAGYRARLFDLLVEGNYRFQFVGCTDLNSNTAMGAAGQQFHNGYGSWRMDAMRTNLDGYTQPRGDSALGGYWLVGGTGAHREPVYPDVVLLLAGTNDLAAGIRGEKLEQRMTALLDWFRVNRPKTRVLVATVPPNGPEKPKSDEYNQAVVTFNQWITQKVPTLSPQFHVVDLHAAFIDATGKVKTAESPDGIFLKDGIHPSHNAYVAMGDLWFAALKPLLAALKPLLAASR